MVVTVYEASLINQRIDDFKRELKDDIIDLKDLIEKMNNRNWGCINENKLDIKNLEERIRALEQMKSKLLGIISGISLLVGLVVGKGLL